MVPSPSMNYSVVLYKAPPPTPENRTPPPILLERGLEVAAQGADEAKAKAKALAEERGLYVHAVSVSADDGSLLVYTADARPAIRPVEGLAFRGAMKATTEPPRFG